jgi:hypothetical protein
VDKAEKLPLPDLYLIDSHKLLRELDRIREMTLAVPVTEANHAATQSVIDALWHLRTDVQEILRVKGEIQQSWQRRSAEQNAENAPPQIGLRLVVHGSKT